MPRYHFHLRNDKSFTDPKGADFPDVEAAKRHAERMGPSLRRIDPRGIVVITDESGATVARCPVAEQDRKDRS